MSFLKQRRMVMTMMVMGSLLLTTFFLYGEGLRFQVHRTGKSFYMHPFQHDMRTEFGLFMSTQSSTISTKKSASPSSPWDFLSSMFSTFSSTGATASSSKLTDIMAELNTNITSNRDILIDAVNTQDASKSDSIVEALM